MYNHPKNQFNHWLCIFNTHGLLFNKACFCHPFKLLQHWFNKPSSLFNTVRCNRNAYYFCAMLMRKTKGGVIQLQLLVWVSVLLLMFFSMLPMDGWAKSVIYTGVNAVFYAIIIYGNISFLYPVFYSKGNRFWYIVLAALLLITTGMLRGYTTLWLYFYFDIYKPEAVTYITLLSYVPGGFLTFVLSFIFRIAIAYFTLKQHTEEILLQKSQAELNLLKSQVQPHFLFNTLNNIYYEAYIEAPRTAVLIERLAEIMRYFVDDSPKAVVPITTEVAFIENYIALEKIRIRHGVDISFTKIFTQELHIPPMLLMTFVENVFKHGIDKASTDNHVDISLIQQDGYLVFNTTNNVYNASASKQPSGFGIANLTKRLTLLYNKNFDLKIDKTDTIFTAVLKIPVA